MKQTTHLGLNVPDNLATDVFDGGLYIKDNFETIDSEMKLTAEQLVDTAKDSTDNDFFNGDIMLIPSYFGFLDNPQGQLELYVTNDGQNLYNVNTDSMFVSKHGGTWDYNLLYKNGYYYFLYDKTNRVACAKTKDFLTFEEYDIPFPSQYVDTWAPEWFEDTNGDIYIFITLGTGLTTTDKYGNTIPYQKNYYVKATDSTLTTFTSPVELKFPDTANRIDPFVIKKDGVYHLFIKNEYSKVIEHFTNNVIDGATTWTLIQTISFPFDAEAAAIVFFKGQYYLYVDCYADGISLFKTSTDLTTWSSPKRVITPANTITRHFTPLVISSSEQKEVIKTTIAKKNKKATFQQSSVTLVNQLKDSIFSPLRWRIDLNQLAVGGVIETLTVKEDFIYFVQGSNQVTINNIDNSLIRENKPVYFIVESSSDGFIKVKNSGNTYFPLGQDFVINRENRNNETVIPFIKVSGAFRLFGVDANPSAVSWKDVDLSPLATGGVINNLQVENGVTYYATGNAQITINNFNLSKFNGKGFVYFILESGDPTARITLTHGGFIAMPGGTNYVINTANSNHDRTITLSNANRWGAFRLSL